MKKIAYADDMPCWTAFEKFVGAAIHFKPDRFGVRWQSVGRSIGKLALTFPAILLVPNLSKLNYMIWHEMIIGLIS